MRKKKFKKRFVKNIDVLVGHRVHKHKVTDEPVYVRIGRYTVGLIISKSRTGKSTLAKIIALNVSNNDRRILIIDPYSEYWRCLFPDFEAEPFCGGFKNFKVYQNIVFKISDFWQIDWMSLGFSDTAAKVLSLISERVDLHRDDFELFKEIVMDLPTTWRDEYRFVNKYGEGFAHALHPATNLHLKGRIEWFEDLFWQEGADGKDIYGRIYIKNFAHQLYKHNIILDFKLQKDQDMTKAAVYTGIVLRQLESHLDKIHPLIIVDEADKFCGNPSLGDDVRYIPSVGNKLLDFTVKLQRCEVGMIYITQDHQFLHPGLVSHWHWKILGVIDSGIDYDVVSKARLRNDQLERFDSSPTAHREFIFMNAARKWVKFMPLRAPTLL